MVEVLAVLSLSAAVGMRIALPLLLIGLLYGGDHPWENVPLLSQLPPSLVLGVLVSGSLVELLWSKAKLGQRFLQIMQMIGSPVVGGIVGLTMARMDLESSMGWVLAILGGLLAFMLQLVQVGWSYRLKGLPLWSIFGQDFLCVVLVLLAFNAPRLGGLLALLLIWLAIRSAADWRQWYFRQVRSASKEG